jgi:hypothetical protein
MIPSFLRETFDNRVEAARQYGQAEYDAYWKEQGKKYQVAECYRCGRRTKHDQGPYHRYDVNCRVCTGDDYAQMEVESLSDQMGVC